MTVDPCPRGPLDNAVSDAVSGAIKNTAEALLGIRQGLTPEAHAAMADVIVEAMRVQVRVLLRAKVAPPDVTGGAA